MRIYSTAAVSAGPGITAAPSRATRTGVAGDVLVRTVPLGSKPHYTLSEIPGPDQVRFRCLADAARQARNYARQRGVDVWSDDGAGQVVRLSRFRLAGAPPLSPASQTPVPPDAASAWADALAEA